MEIGDKFGRLTVLEVRGKKQRSDWMALCLCECGTEKFVAHGSMASGNTKSCGCLRREMVVSKNTTHSMSRHPVYQIWQYMLKRCNNPKDKNYHHYGGRGIQVCDRWFKVENFIEDMLGGYEPGLTLDRIDNNGDYCLENCRWATQKEQCNNTRVNHVVNFNGTALTVTQWEERLGFRKNTISARLSRGWSEERALSTKVKLKQSGKLYLNPTKDKHTEVKNAIHA